jgi:hypothetical protein
MAYPTRTYQDLLAHGWTAHQAKVRSGSASFKVILVFWDDHGNALTQCTGEGETVDVARDRATSRANAFLFRTQAVWSLEPPAP